MTDIILPQLEKIHFTDGSRTYFGASQHMYLERFKRVRGCGPTTASNQMLYLSQQRPGLERLFPYPCITKEHVLAQMNVMWDFVTPMMYGLTDIYKLAKGGVAYGKSVGVSLRKRTLAIDPAETRHSIDTVAQWLIDQLEKELPVAFLNLDHGRVSNLEGWHWVTLVGIMYDGEELVTALYDNGTHKSVNLGEWLQNTRRKGGFVSFEPI